MRLRTQAEIEAARERHVLEAQIDKLIAQRDALLDLCRRVNAYNNKVIDMGGDIMWGPPLQELEDFIERAEKGETGE